MSIVSTVQYTQAMPHTHVLEVVGPRPPPLRVDAIDLYQATIGMQHWL